MDKTIRVSQIAVPLRHTKEQVFQRACRKAGIRPQEVRRFSVAKQSLDARHKNDLKYSYTADLEVNQKVHYKKDPHVQEYIPAVYHPEAAGQEAWNDPIAVIGSGPAGLFCAWLLAKYGYAPVVFERGKCVEERQADVEDFWNGGKLNPESNVQFGEGGAGTFSDGKLNTQVKDKSGRNRFVLETFVDCGAPEDILFAGRPHIGTDILRTVVANMRREIIRMGGTFYFSSCVTDFRFGKGGLKALQINHRDWQPVSAAVLAVGHSARDTFAVLKRHQIPMIPKAFAVGFRVEHPQQMINENQYGTGKDSGLLPAAFYKLACRTQTGRNVYSFCMCPGGYVVNASSEEGRLAVNGMSDRARDSQNANSAIIVSVTPEDFPDPADPLSGIEFQRILEEKAWKAGGGKIPQQRFGAFAECVRNMEPDTEVSPAADGAGDREGFQSCVRGQSSEADLSRIFPAEINRAFVEGMGIFGQRIRGFDREDAILSGVESRTSSPVRILREDSLQSQVKNLYPCGEGAGYAGGITSAAMDGLKTAEALMARFAPRGNMLPDPEAGKQ